MDHQAPPGSTRKRGRSTTPTPAASGSSASSSLRRGSGGGGTAAPGGGAVAVRAESTDDTIRASQLRDANQRIKALNALLRLSTSHDTNYALSGDSVLRELLKISIHDCLQWPKDVPLLSCSPVLSGRGANQQTSLQGGTTKPVFSSSSAWIKAPTDHMEAWSQHCRVMLGGAGNKRGDNIIYSLAPAATTVDPSSSSSSSSSLSCMTREQFQILNVIIAILRNLSFVSANLRMLAYTPDVLALLVGCLYDDGSNETTTGTSNNMMSAEEAATAVASTTTSTLAVSAITTLIHLSPYLDVSGQRLLSDKLFYSPTIARDGPLVPSSTTSSSSNNINGGKGAAANAATLFGQAAGGSWGFGGLWLAKRLDTKEDVVADVSHEFLVSMTADYLVGVWSLFAALAWILTNPRSPRPVLLMAVDLLQELINHARVGVVGSVDLTEDEDKIPTVRAILVNMPDKVLERLVDFLYVPRLGPDALEYLDPVNNVVTRVTTLRLLMGYDATVDTDIRDRVLDLLVPLLELDSPRMAVRLGCTETTTSSNNKVDGEQGDGGDDDNEEEKKEYKPRMRLFDAIVPILKTTVGRNEAPQLASQLLRELSKAKEENRVGLLCIQERLIELASNDNQRVSSVVWNHLYPPDVDEAAALSAAEASGLEEGDSEAE